jgi:predicted nucleic-acid-binding protein
MIGLDANVLAQDDPVQSPRAIGALGVSAGCSHTVTFDRKALRLPDFAPA